METIFGGKWYENMFGAGTFNTTHLDRIIAKTLSHFKHLDYYKNSATTAINRIQDVSRTLTFQAPYPLYRVPSVVSACRRCCFQGNSKWRM